MSQVQEIFRSILSNKNMFYNFKAGYDAAALRRLFSLTDDEANELDYFIQTTDLIADEYR